METRHASIDEEKLSIGAAARLAGVSVDTMRRWANKDLIPVQVGPAGHRRFLRSDVDELVKKRRVGDDDSATAAAS